MEKKQKCKHAYNDETITEEGKETCVYCGEPRNINAENFKELQKENEEIRDSIDNCLPIDEAENKDVWEKINELINNEINQELCCNQ